MCGHVWAIHGGSGCNCVYAPVRVSFSLRVSWCVCVCLTTCEPAYVQVSVRMSQRVCVRAYHGVLPCLPGRALRTMKDRKTGTPSRAYAYVPSPGCGKAVGVVELGQADELMALLTGQGSGGRTAFSIRIEDGVSNQGRRQGPKLRVCESRDACGDSSRV